MAFLCKGINMLFKEKGKPEAGDWKPEAGNRRPGTGDLIRLPRSGLNYDSSFIQELRNFFNR